jgi:hypothetical protein
MRVITTFEQYSAMMESAKSIMGNRFAVIAGQHFDFSTVDEYTHIVAIFDAKGCSNISHANSALMEKDAFRTAFVFNNRDYRQARVMFKTLIANALDEF